VVADSHAASGALVTMALAPNHEPDRYGGVRLDSEGRAVGFAPRGNAAGSYHFVGVQVVESEAFAALPAGEPARSVGGVYDELIAARPGSIRGVVCDASFWDVGTVADYWFTSWSFAARESHPGVISGRRVSVASTARVSQSILWDDIEVSPDAVLDDCVVTDGVRVPAGAHYRRAILLRGRNDTVLTSPLLV